MMVFGGLVLIGLKCDFYYICVDSLATLRAERWNINFEEKKSMQPLSE